MSKTTPGPTKKNDDDNGFASSMFGDLEDCSELSTSELSSVVGGAARGQGQQAIQSAQDLFQHAQHEFNLAGSAHSLSAQAADFNAAGEGFEQAAAKDAAEHHFGEAQHALNSAENAFAQDHNIEGQAQAYETSGAMFAENGHNNLASHAYEHAANMLDQNNEAKEAGQAFNQSAHYAAAAGHVTEAGTGFRNAASAFASSDDMADAGEAHLNASKEMITGHHDRTALSDLSDAASEFTASGNVKEAGEAYQAEGSMLVHSMEEHMQSGQLDPQTVQVAEEAAQSYQHAEADFKQVGDTKDATAISGQESAIKEMSAGFAAESNGHFSQADKDFQQAEATYKQIGEGTNAQSALVSRENDLQSAAQTESNAGHWNQAAKLEETDAELLAASGHQEQAGQMYEQAGNSLEQAADTNDNLKSGMLLESASSMFLKSGDTQSAALAEANAAAKLENVNAGMAEQAYAEAGKLFTEIGDTGAAAQSKLAANAEKTIVGFEQRGINIENEIAAGVKAGTLNVAQVDQLLSTEANDFDAAAELAPHGSALSMANLEQGGAAWSQMGSLETNGHMRKAAFENAARDFAGAGDYEDAASAEVSVAKVDLNVFEDLGETQDALKTAASFFTAAGDTQSAAQVEQADLQIKNEDTVEWKIDHAFTDLGKDLDSFEHNTAHQIESTAGGIVAAAGGIAAGVAKLVSTGDPGTLEGAIAADTKATVSDLNLEFGDLKSSIVEGNWELLGTELAEADMNLETDGGGE